MMGEKLITFCVPCYNSQDYMRNCIDGLLTAGEDAEIVIVNDGSTDNTAAIADEYAAHYPTIVRAVHKENGGHGSGVNKGLELASGKYYKVVDSDDWLDQDALHALITLIKEHQREGNAADLYITNYVYEKVHEGTRCVRRYTKNFPQGEFFGWDKVKKFSASNVLLMHSLLYSTEKLRQSKTVLPEHTFYVDNIFAYKPLPYMEKLYYLDADLYRYYIGRSDQSVTRENIVKRYRQQIRVMREMLSSYTYEEIGRMPEGLAKYMKHDLAVIMLLTLMFTTAGKNELDERKEQLRSFWCDLKQNDKKMYNYLRKRAYPALIDWMSFSMQGSVTAAGYSLVRRVLKCS